MYRMPGTLYSLKLIFWLAMCWHLGSRIVSLWSWDDKRTGHGCWNGKLSLGILANGHKNLRVSKNINLVSVVQLLDSIILQINPYLLDSAISIPNTYHWIVIYLVYGAVQLLNNWDLIWKNEYTVAVVPFATPIFVTSHSKLHMNCNTLMSC